MSLLLREMGFSLADLATSPDPELLRGLFGGMTIYRGAQAFRMDYDRLLTRLMWKSAWTPWIVRISQVSRS